MKLVIAGTAHDLQDALQNATLADLLALKVKTGIGMKTLAKYLQHMDDLADPTDVIDDEQSLVGLNALVWLCRRRAGERLSFEAANDIPVADISFEADEDDEQPAEAADPTPALTVTAQGDADPAAKPKVAAGSKTSKRKSTTGS